MNNQLTVRQLLDKVQEQLEGQIFSNKFGAELEVSRAVQDILRDNGIAEGSVRFMKSPWGATHGNTFVLMCPNRNEMVHVNLRLKQVKKADGYAHRYSTTDWSLKELETWGNEDNTTILDLVARDTKIKEDIEKKKQDTKEELFELMDEVGYERFKKLAKFYTDKAYSLEKEYEARA